MKKNILITFKHTPHVIKTFEEEFNVFTLKGLKYNNETILDICRKNKIDGIMVSGGQRVNAELIDALPDSVKIIATSSVGFDHLDLAKAHAKNIILTNTPDVLSAATADVAMTLLLNVSRRIKEYAKVMEEGWKQTFGQSEMLGVDLKGKNLGILGMGSIGREMAMRARAFGMNILYNNRKKLPPELENGCEYVASFDELLKRSDVISLHAPATAETKNIMNERAFSLMKKGSIFINVARGSLVDEEALLHALDSGHLFGAGLDVFQKEPGFDKRFLSYSNVFLTPHIGSSTIETRDAMGILAFQNIKAVLSGKAAVTPISR